MNQNSLALTWKHQGPHDSADLQVRADLQYSTDFKSSTDLHSSSKKALTVTITLIFKVAGFPKTALISWETQT